MEILGDSKVGIAVRAVWAFPILPILSILGYFRLLDCNIHEGCASSFGHRKLHSFRAFVSSSQARVGVHAFVIATLLLTEVRLLQIVVDHLVLLQLFLKVDFSVERVDEVLDFVHHLVEACGHMGDIGTILVGRHVAGHGTECARFARFTNSRRRCRPARAALEYGIGRSRSELGLVVA